MTRNNPWYPLTVVVLAAIAAAVLLGAPSLVGTPGQIALGVLLLLVFPGYVVVYLLFGRSSSPLAENTQRRFGGEERSRVVPLAVAIGFSIVLVPILVRGVMVTVGYSRTSVILAVAAFVVVLGTVGAVLARRSPASSHQSTGASVSSVPGRIRAYFDRDTRFGLVTSLLLVASVIFFLSTVGFAFSGDPAGDPYTEFYLLTENESGDLVASDYPATLSEAQSTQLAVGIENHEHEAVTYTLVVEVQRLDNQSVVEEREDFRTRRTVGADENATIEHSVSTQMAGSDLRVQYYLYRGEAPADATVESAYRTVHLSLDATG